MKNFERKDLMFSLCGLNCALCTMKLDGYCPGCGGGAGNQGCAIAKCSLQHNIDYCFECEKYPCDKYKGIDEFDSFIIHRHQLIDMEKAQRIGIEAYHAELNEKSVILKILLANFNDGRRKGFYCIAVNLMSLQDIKEVMSQIQNNISETSTIKEKATIVAELFTKKANEQGIVLKLNKKRSK